MPVDVFHDRTPGLTSPPSRVFAVTPDDGADLALATRALMVAAGGDVKVTTVAGDEAVLPALTPGVQYAVRAARIWASGTTATGVVGLA